MERPSGWFHYPTMSPTYGLQELRDFIVRHEAAAKGLVEVTTALRWWQLGWVCQIAWKPTPLCRDLIERDLH